MGPTKTEKGSSLLELALVAAAFVPLLIGASNEIQEVDPAQYAEVGRRMFESGDWARLKDNAGPFLNKPPMTFWLMAGAFRLFGETSFAVRLPSLVMGVVLLAATARIGALLLGRRTGMLGAALLGASPAFQLMVADPKVDMVTTALMACTLLCLLEARRRPAMVHLAWAAAGLGILTKGPIGLVAPALAVLPEALRQRWGGGEGPGSADSTWARLWRRLLPFKPLAGPLLLAAVVAPWFLELGREHGAKGPLFMIWTQGLGRLLGNEWRNDTTPAFFLHTGLWAFLPFTLLLLFELAHRFQAFRRSGWRLPPDERRVLLWWLALPFVIISLSRFKLPQYLYWLGPPAALLAAQGLERAAAEHTGRAFRALGRIHGALALLVPPLVLFMLRVCFPAGTGATASWMLGAVALAGVGMLATLRLPRAQGLAALAVLPFTGANLFFEGHIHPSLLEYQPSREVGELAREVDPRGRVLPFFRAASDPANGYAFYARRSAVDVELEELVALVSRGEARVAVVSPESFALLPGAGLTAERLLELPWYRTSRPSRAFLQASTRPSQVRPIWLVRLAPGGAAR